MSQLVPFFQQLAFVGAVLGGFAFAFLSSLLGMDVERRVVGWALGATLISAAGFVVCTVAGVAGAIWLLDRPEVLASDAIPAAARSALRLASAAFGLGTLGLLTGLGLAGWIRSRALGALSVAAAAVAFLVLAYFLTAVVELV